MREREVVFECSIELARGVVVSPDSMVVHADGHEAAGIADPESRPLPAAQVMGDLPWAYTADHRKYEAPPRLEQAKQLTRHRFQIGHAVQRPEIGIRSVIRSFTLQSLQLVRPGDERSNARRQLFLRGAFGRPPHHLVGPVRGDDPMADAGHANSVEAGAATQVEQATARGE